MKKIKKLLAVLMVVVISMLTVVHAFATTELKSNEFSEMKETQLEPYFEIAKESVETYYESSMSGDNSNNKAELSSNLKDLPITDTVKSYMESKCEYDSIHPEELGYTKSYIDGEYEVLSWETVDDKLLCNIGAEVVFQYSDSDSRSVIGETVQVLIDNPQEPEIKDWYVDMSSFDMEVRGYGLNLSEKSNWLENQKASVLAKTESEIIDSRKEDAKFEKIQAKQFSNSEKVVQEDSNLSYVYPTSVAIID